MKGTEIQGRPFFANAREALDMQPFERTPCERQIFALCIKMSIPEFLLYEYAR